MTDTDTVTITAPPTGIAVTTGTTTAPPAPPPSVWHTGIEAEFLGHAQNKGWNLDDPKQAFVAAAKQARDLERHFGVPPDQLLKLPKADAPEADLKAFYQKLGAPADPKDYDFSAVKFNGQPLDDAFQAAMRATLAQAYVPKDRAATVTQGVVKFLEDADKAEATELAAKAALEKDALQKQWGTNFDYNKAKAADGARRLGFDVEIINALEKQAGYARVMEAMRKVGMVSSEAAFVDGTSGTAGNVMTVDGAIARKAELDSDPVFRQRLLSGDKTADREYHRLGAFIAGETPLY